MWLKTSPINRATTFGRASSAATIVLLVFVLLPFSFFLFSSCGGASWQFDVNIPSQSPPYVHRIDPAAGKTGDTVTIFGFGFSIETGSNVISFGSTSTLASGYSLLAAPSEGEIESLTVTIPNGVTVGDVSVYITVYENTSNADLSFTVNE